MYRHVLLALLIPAAALAQGDDAARARAAVSRGEILRLSEVMPRVERQFGGLVLDTVLLKEGRSYTYAFDLLTRDGRLIEVLVNAATGEVAGIARNGGNGGNDRVAGNRGPSGGHGGDDDDDNDDDDGDDDDDDGDDDDGDDDGGDDHGGDDDGGDDDGGDDDGGSGGDRD